jgi:hypothetical protein
VKTDIPVKKLETIMRPISFFAIAVLTAACGTKEAPPPPPPVAAATPVPTLAPPAVSTVTLGSAIGADNAVTAASESFGVKGPIYASVATTGAGHVKLRALWTFVKGDKTATVNDKTLEFQATGPATNEFHIENPKDWPKGDYRLEIFLGDSTTPAATKTFKVQ